MKRLLHGLALLTLTALLAACGPQKQSVFPPTVTVQQMKLAADGTWNLTLRVQNNGYAGMQYNSLEGNLQIGEQEPARVHSSFNLPVPALSGDVLQVQLLPTPAMSQALAAVAAKGSSGSLPYTLRGVIHGTPDLDDHPDNKNPRDFPITHNDYLSPVPGITNTYR